MSNKDKLFTEELARRNPDWKEIVAAHNAALAAEVEVGHNTAVALGQQIIKLEDQLAAAVEALKELREMSEPYPYNSNRNIIAAALAKIGVK